MYCSLARISSLNTMVKGISACACRKCAAFTSRQNWRPTVYAMQNALCIFPCVQHKMNFAIRARLKPMTIAKNGTLSLQHHHSYGMMHFLVAFNYNCKRKKLIKNVRREESRCENTCIRTTWPVTTIRFVWASHNCNKSRWKEVKNDKNHNVQANSAGSFRKRDSTLFFTSSVVWLFFLRRWISRSCADCTDVLTDDEYIHANDIIAFTDLGYANKQT